MVVLLLIAAVAALCVWRWDIFFHVTTERSYSLDGGPGSITMTAGEDGLADRTFAWKMPTADSCLFILTLPDGTLDTTVSHGTQVNTMGGEQYMHVVKKQHLEPGAYTYRIVEAVKQQCVTLEEPFVVRQFYEQQDSLRFVAFGDLLITEESNYNVLRTLIEPSANLYDAVLYTGNIVKECTHQNWHRWYSSMYGLQGLVPQLGVPGSRDYERGIDREIDPRWTYRFPMPLNGPERFLGTTSYVDYPLCRLIFLDTETLELLVDYTVLQTWLSRTLSEAGERWKIVVMHHSVHSVSAGFDHPRLYTALHHTLDDADLIVSGSDLTYGRRCDISLSDLLNNQQTVPVYMVLTSDSTESAVPKCSPMDHRIGSNRAFFSTVVVSPQQLEVQTRYLAHPDSLYDGFTIDYSSRVVTEMDSLPAEVIEMPENYTGISLRARRFEHLRDARIRRMAED